MRLRVKLLLIALLTAVFPLAGWRFIQQMEDTLREGQEQALLASGRAIAQAVLALEPGWALQASAPGRWYAHEVGNAFQMDGYDDDWRALNAPAQALGDSAALELDFRAAIGNRWLYLWLQVRDPTPSLPELPLVPVARGDHLVMVYDGHAHRLGCAGDGPLLSEPLPTVAQPLPAAPIRGYCRRSAAGYTLELELPRSNLLPQLAIRVLDQQGEEPRRSIGSLDAGRLIAWPVVPVDVQSARLAALAPAGVRLRLLSPEGWVLARAGRLGEVVPSSSDPGLKRWLRTVVYRTLLAPPLGDGDAYRLDHVLLTTPETDAAREGREATGWRSAATSIAVVLSVAVPVGGEAGSGALLLEREADALLIWTNRALGTLMFGGLLSMLLAGALLFGYTGWLSWRIRRLKDAAESALTPEGRLRGDFPRSRALDEVGDLSRSFARLLDQLGQYNDYLRTLTAKLSHELATPLAVVRSSLDNLEHEPLPDSARPYAERARAGIERLRRLLRAMSEAQRIEQAIATLDVERLDLVQLAAAAAEAYRGVVRTEGRSVRIELEPAPQPVWLSGSPELIFQALDKLFDNALGFVPEHGGWIRITLAAVSGGGEIRVANNGPPLPKRMQGQLFESMVSLRGEGSGAHLGLGLYVVRLVAEAHAGSVSAADLPDGGGVVFTLLLKNVDRPEARGDAGREAD